MTARTDRFRALHADGTFLIPNPWDQGSARYLEWRGFPALATTSSGFAATLGRRDGEISKDELVAHTEAIAASVDVPVNVDAERCFAEEAAGVADTVVLLADAGAAGLSIEDYDPGTDAIDAVDVAVERVGVAAEAARSRGLVLTARTERHLYGGTGLDETIERLSAYGRAGAEVLYAPGLMTMEEIATVVDAVSQPVNVLAMPGTPSVADLTAAGVRRISTGGALAWTALGGLGRAVDRWLDDGTSDYGADRLPAADVAAALSPRAART